MTLKRNDVAVTILQSLLSNPAVAIKASTAQTRKELCENAVLYADELIKELSRTRPRERPVITVI